MVSRKDLTTVVFFLSYVQELLISFLHCGAVFASNMVSSTVHTASHHPDVDALYSRTYDETEREVFPWGFRIISCVTSRITSSIPVIKTPICSLTSFFFFPWFYDMQRSVLPESKGNTGGWVIWILLKILEFRTKASWELSDVNSRGMELPFMEVPGSSRGWEDYLFLGLHELR